MEKLYPQMIVEALQTVTYAGTKKNIIESGMLADQPAVDNKNNKVRIYKPSLNRNHDLKLERCSHR